MRSSFCYLSSCIKSVGCVWWCWERRVVTQQEELEKVSFI